MATSGPYDVIVVGAGLTGALVASILAEEGLQVVVLEATKALGGTVRRVPALALLGTPEPFAEIQTRHGAEVGRRIWELTAENLARLEALLGRAGATSWKPGSLRLAVDTAQAESFRESAAQLSALGYTVKLEDDSRYGDLVALNTADDLLFEPQALINSLLDHENIIVELNAEVHAIKPRSDGSLAVWAYRHYLWADKIIFANGIHAARVVSGLAEALHPACVHTLIFENANALERPLILSNGRVCCLPHGDHVYLAGWDDNELATLDRLAPVVNQLFPDSAVLERFTAWTARSEDMLPVVGKLHQIPSAYVVDGLGPFGLSLALIAADQLVDVILEDRSPELFDVGRFWRQG